MKAVMLAPCGHPFAARVDMNEPASCRDCLAVAANKGPVHLEGRGYPAGFESMAPPSIAASLRASGIDASYDAGNGRFIITTEHARMLAFLLHRHTEPRLLDVPGERQGIMIPRDVKEELDKFKPH